LEVLYNPWFYPIALSAVFITGMGKSGFGTAGGLAVPMLALVMSPVQAAAVMLPLLLASDAAGVWAYRRDWDRGNMKIILPAGLAGTAIGWATFRYLDENALRIILGAISLGFVASSLVWHNLPARTPSKLKGWFWCTVSGVTSFVAQAGGPPLWVYLLPQRLEKRLQTGTTLVFFAILNVSKIYPYFALGLLTAANLAIAGALIPVALVGIVVGLRVQKRLSTQWFFRICYGILLLTGVQLVYKGVAGL
jgi:uncharacterized membrane protein YfcA